MLGIYYQGEYHVKKEIKKAMELFMSAHVEGVEEAGKIIEKIVNSKGADIDFSK